MFAQSFELANLIEIEDSAQRRLTGQKDASDDVLTVFQTVEFVISVAKQITVFVERAAAFNYRLAAIKPITDQQTPVVWIREVPEWVRFESLSQAMRQRSDVL